ncbi:MAG: glycoside hydrolase family 10 protein, partial [Muribaculaceae bacterium]
MRKNFIQLFIAVTAVFMTQFNLWADDYPKQEMRAVWMSTVFCIDWPSTTGTSSSVQQTQKNEMTGYLDKLQAAGINAVFFQVRTMCDAFYKSSYEPWSSYLTGSRGSDPGWDPLTFVVEECHKRNMECHAWVNPYRFSTGSNWTTTNDNAMKNNGWLITHNVVGKDANGNQTTTPTTIMNPGNASARWRIVNICKEIVNNYDIDGLVFDDYFYPNGIPEDSSAADYSTYTSSGTSLSFADWRRSQVNLMVKNVYDMIRSSSKPWIRFGISPAGAACSDATVAAKHGVEPLSLYCSASDWQYSQIYSDPVQWLQDGTVDYISPQLYWISTHATNPFGPMTNWWSKVASGFNRHHFASHDLYFLQSNNTTANWQEIGKQLQYSRAYTQNDAPGSVYFCAREITGKKVSGLGDWLKEYKYQNKSVPPAMTWYTATDPGKIASLSVSGSTLSCSSMSGVRYLFYAIPNNVSRNSAKSTNSNGLKAEYIVDMSYTNSVSISGKTSGYWYAVAPFDRYGNEWQLTTLNEPLIDPAPASTPISPATGSALKPSSITFTFSKVDVDSYKLQIASDINFSNMLFNQTISPNNTADGNYSYTYDGKSLADGDYYWRIVTSKEGYKDTNSSILYFSVNNISEPCEAVTLLSPANGTEFNLGNIEMVFTDTQADNYVLHVAMNEDFTYMTFDSSKAPVTNADGNLYFTGPVSVFPDGTYYWKVETSLAGYYNNESEVRSFVVNRPTLSSPQLISPANGNVLTEDGGTFTATDVDADAYKIEFSLYEDFSTILYSSTDFTPKGTQVSFTVSNIGMINNTKHYWRVIASKDGGYHDGVSEKGYFTVALPGAKVSTIFYPENDFTFDCTDVVICVSNPAGTTTKLEIADDSEFKNIVYSSYSYTVIDELGAPQYIIPYTKFSTGKYYFRMVTSQDGLKDGVSEVRYFNVIADDSNAAVTMEDTEYPLITSGSGGYFKFTNLWIKSNVLGNLFTSGNTQVNRDFAVRNINADGEGYVMVTYSSENTSSATKKILKFNAATGEQYSDMSISFPSSYTTNAGGYTQLNNIMVDDNQEVLVSNLALTSGKYLVFGKYNTSTGVVSSIIENLT